MNALQELVTRRLADLDLSYRTAAERAGGLMSHTTLNSIVLGRQRRLNGRTVVGLAKALEVSQDAIRQAAGRPDEGAVEFALPARADRLSARSRSALLDMMDALLRAENAAADLQVATERDVVTTEPARDRLG